MSTTYIRNKAAISEYHQVTKPSKALAKEICAGINKDYPNKAVVYKDSCWITKEHYKYCKDYVLTKCKIEDRNKAGEKC